MNIDYYDKYKKYKNKYLTYKYGGLYKNPIVFINELDRRSTLIYGENMSKEYNVTGVGDLRVAFFFKIVRGLNKDDIKEFVDEILKLYKNTNDKSLIIDLFTILYQTRDIRGGKGERKIFYDMIIYLYDFYPKTILNLLCLIPFYGYFKDYFNLLSLLYNNNRKYLEFIDTIYELVLNQLNLDITEYNLAIKEERNPKLSLLAKYIPKEGKKFDRKYKFVEKISMLLFKDNKPIDDLKMMYRKKISQLNQALDTVEIKMSARKYAEINFTKLTSKSVFKYRKAFLNLYVPPELELIIDEDRQKAKEKFLKAIKDKKINGKQLEIYEITKVVINGNVNEAEKQLFQVQWESIRNNLLDTLNKTENFDIKVSNLLPIIDVSGSMTGLPMYVAISMGILLSEISENIKDKFITFSETPNWVNLSNEPDIVSKIQKTRNSPWGMNTNFEAVYNMLLDVIIDKKLTPNEIPDLIVFSDMQFDQAAGRNNNWQTHHEIIVEKFKDAGIKISGQPYNPPKIIYWNLRSDTIGFPAQANTPNVEMISGFSPNLLKHILTGNLQSGFKTITPYDTLRNILDDDRYELVREIVSATGEIS